MKIGIITSYVSKNPAGLERYAFELINHLVRSGPENQYLIYIKKGTGLGGLEDLVNLTDVKIVSVWGGRLWKDLGLALCEKSDTYIYTGPIGSLFFRPRRSLVIVYDFAYRYINSGWRDKINNFIIDTYSRRIFSVTNKIVAISQETKDELLKLFKVSPEKVVVIYPGFNKICQLTEEKVSLPQEKFFLFIGTIKERKNVLNIVKAFELFLRESGQDCGLVIAGKYKTEDSYYQSLVRFIGDKEIGDRVTFLGHINDNQLSFLYHKAVGLVYPSIIEGFGLPLLEAMDCDLPVISSNISSLREIASDAGLLVDPLSVEEISGAMKTLFSKPEEVSRLIKMGNDREKSFSWEECARLFSVLISKI